MKRAMVDRSYPTWGRGNREDASQGGSIQGSGNWEDTRLGANIRGGRGDASQGAAAWSSSNDWDDTRQGGASNDWDDKRQGSATWGSSNDWDDTRQGGATWGSSKDWVDTRQGGATWGSSNDWDDTRQGGDTWGSGNNWDNTRHGGATWESRTNWDDASQGGATWGSRNKWDYTSQGGTPRVSRDGASQCGATWGSSNNWDDTSQGGATWGSRDDASQGGATWGSSNNWDDTSQGGATWGSRDCASQGGATYGSNTWDASEGSAAWGNRGDKSWGDLGWDSITRASSNREDTNQGNVTWENKDRYFLSHSNVDRENMARDSTNRDNVARGYTSRDYITRGNIQSDGGRLGNMTGGVLSRGKVNGGDFNHSNMKKDYMTWGNMNIGDLNRDDSDMNEEKHKKPDKPEDDGTFFCEICQVTCLSYMNYLSHTRGTKHLKRTGLTESSSKLIKSRKTLKDHMNEPVREPLIGLEYVIEYRLEESSDRIYNCELCDFKRELSTMLEHLTSFKHRRAYVKKEYPFILEEPRIPKEDKVQFLRRIAAELERDKGLKMYRIDPLSKKKVQPLPESNQDEIPNKRSRDQNEIIEKAQCDAGTDDWSYDSTVQVAQAQKTVQGNPEKGNSKLVQLAPRKPHGQGGIPTGNNGFGNSFSRFDSGPPPDNTSGGRSRLITNANSFQRTNPSATGLSRVLDAPGVENTEAGYWRGLQDQGTRFQLSGNPSNFSAGPKKLAARIDTEEIIGDVGYSQFHSPNADRMPFGTSSSLVPRFLAPEKADKKAGPLSAEILNRIRGKDVQSASSILRSFAATNPELKKVNLSNLLNLLVQTGTIIE